jgi:hypothetical protein
MNMIQTRGMSIDNNVVTEGADYPNPDGTDQCEK